MSLKIGYPLLLGALLFGLVVAVPATAAPLGGDFTLQSVEGTVSLRSLRGQVVPIYFGYMSCPDLCPMTLSALAVAMRSLEEAERERVQALFISLDPERDDLPRLSDYARHFHPRIEGVTGSPAVVAEVAGRYRVVVAKVPGADADRYTLDHTSRLALVGRDGELRRLMPDGTPPAEIAAAIRDLLAE